MITQAVEIMRASNPLRTLRFDRVALATHTGQTVSTEGVRTGLRNWHDAFFTALASAEFAGDVEWTYNYDELTCIALASCLHCDSAVRVMSAFVAECNSVTDWQDSYEQTYGETMAGTLVRDAVLITCDFALPDDEVKQGWRLVLTNIDTSMIGNVRQQLPTTVRQWMNPPAIDAQVGA